MDITSQPGELAIDYERRKGLSFFFFFLSFYGMNGGCPSFGIIAKRRISSHLAARVPAEVQGFLAEVRKQWGRHGRRSHRVI